MSSQDEAVPFQIPGGIQHRLVDLGQILGPRGGEFDFDGEGTAVFGLVQHGKQFREGNVALAQSGEIPFLPAAGLVLQDV